jgi:hypothetical protein
VIQKRCTKLPIAQLRGASENFSWDFPHPALLCPFAHVSGVAERVLNAFLFFTYLVIKLILLGKME